MALDPVTGVLEIGGKLIDRLWPDPEKADAAKLELFKLNQSGELAILAGQMKINEAEATHASVFVSGWRPFIGWVCGSACAWNWIGLPIAKMALAVFGIQIALDSADLTEMLPVLVGMLGIGTLRTVEKINKVASK